MSNPANQSTTLNGTKLLGYAVAGGILLVLADVAPKIAVPTTGLILLAVTLSHADQFTTLAGWISTATGTTAANQNPTVPTGTPPTMPTPTGGRPTL